MLKRRDFLKWTTSALLGASGLIGTEILIRYLDAQTGATAPTIFDLGPAQDYPVGTRTVFPDIPALLIHDETGFSALSLVCTHLGCTVEVQNDGFACPCHGSRYYLQGNVSHGPAQQALHPLRLETTVENHLRLFLSDEA